MAILIKVWEKAALRKVIRVRVCSAKASEASIGYEKWSKPVATTTTTRRRTRTKTRIRTRRRTITRSRRRRRTERTIEITARRAKPSQC